MVRAVSFDLDDTLWPIMPAITAAESALNAWLISNCPEVAIAWPVEKMRSLRDQAVLDSPELTHDFSALRRLSLRAAMLPFGYSETDVEQAFDVFFSERNRVMLFPEVTQSLQKLSQRWTLASLTNGNADLIRIGLAKYFKVQVCPLRAGCAKPDPRIFHFTASALGIEPTHIAHVGDDPELDVLGAKRAGMVSVWVNREQAEWPYENRPDIEINSLDQLECHLDARSRGQADHRYL
jgi:HAD superfamily hydrolase (TIGR01509 family)